MKKLFIFIIILLAIGAAAWLYFQNKPSQNLPPAETPYSRGPTSPPKISAPTNP